MRRLILGTAGHIDHGKTALVRALTGIDTDRLPEEKRRGITIELGFANLVLPSGTEIGIVDVPGHEAFVRNMLAGATGVDLALLVIAADESVMPQTREHLAILELLGVRAGVIALTKTDLVEPEWLDLVTAEVSDTVAHGPLATAAIVRVSARTGEGLRDLVGAIDRAATAIPGRTDRDLFRLPIDRVFTVRGTGTVVTGTVWSGSIAVEETVRLLPSDRTARVRGVQAFGVERERVSAGERAAVALAGIAREQVDRGDILATGPGWMPTSMLTTKLRVLRSSPHALPSRQRIRFHLGTAEVLGRVALLDATEIQPGDERWVQLRLEAPVVARAGDRFVIRSYSPVTTIAGGLVAEPLPAKRKRLSRADIATLEASLDGPPASAIDAFVRAREHRGIHRELLPIVLPFSTSAIDDALRTHESVEVLDALVVHAAAARDVRARLRDAVDRQHETDPLAPGAALDALRRAAPAGTAPPLFDWALRSLVADGALVWEGVTVRRAGFAPRLDPEQEAAAASLTELLARAALTPPLLSELPRPLRDRSDLPRLLRFLERRGDLTQLAPGLWIASSAIRTAVDQAFDRLGDRPGLTPGDFKDLYGITRKYLIPLLEHFDRTGVTARHGDLRDLVRA